MGPSNIGDQRTQSKSGLYGNAREEIPGLTRWSRINGKRNSLFCLILGPVINGNTTHRPKSQGTAAPMVAAMSIVSR